MTLSQASRNDRPSVAFKTQNTQRYFDDVAAIPLLNPDEEAQLAAKMRQGDEQAREKLIKANLRFVISVATKYQGRGLSLDDLIAEGNRGLISATKNFDPSKGFKFISFASQHIHYCIKDALGSNNRFIHVPGNIIKHQKRIEECINRHLGSYNLQPTPEIIAQECDVEVQEVIEFLSIPQTDSLDINLRNEDGSSLYTFLSETNTPLPDEDLIKESEERQLKLWLSILGQSKKEMLSLKMGLTDYAPMTNQDIAELFGYKTGERPRQINEATLKELYTQKDLFLALWNKGLTPISAATYEQLLSNLFLADS